MAAFSATATRALRPAAARSPIPSIVTGGARCAGLSSARPAVIGGIVKARAAAAAASSRNDHAIIKSIAVFSNIGRAATTAAY
jgi:hypothetical protein